MVPKEVPQHPDRCLALLCPCVVYRLSEKEDYGAFIEGNLRQLLSRDIMYHPVKQICDRFPEWLAVQEDTLPREEYIRYSLACRSCFLRREIGWSHTTCLQSLLSRITISSTRIL